MNVIKTIRKPLKTIFNLTTTKCRRHIDNPKVKKKMYVHREQEKKKQLTNDTPHTNRFHVTKFLINNNFVSRKKKKINK